MKIFIDGKFYSKDDAKISVFDHGLLYGDGIFEGIRIYNGKIFKNREHIVRLFDSAKAIGLNINYSIDEMCDLVQNCVLENQKENGYIRLIVTRGVGNLGVDPRSCPSSSVIVIVGDIQLYPKEFYEKGIEIVTSTYRRVPVSAFDVRVKSLNYLNNVLAKTEAIDRGVFESVMLDNNGFVAECTGDNIFIVKNDKILTPLCAYGALDGITRGVVFEISENNNIKISDTVLTRYDLWTSDECFLTGTGAEIIPVIKIDGKIIGDGNPGKMTQKIIHEFKKYITNI